MFIPFNDLVRWNYNRISFKICNDILNKVYFSSCIPFFHISLTRIFYRVSAHT